MISESFKADLLPPGSRVAVLAHLEHSPAVHELLWGWHREQHNENGWALVGRAPGAARESDRQLDHLG